jgi:hypothetical protein
MRKKEAIYPSMISGCLVSDLMSQTRKTLFKPLQHTSQWMYGKYSLANIFRQKIAPRPTLWCSAVVVNNVLNFSYIFSKFSSNYNYNRCYYAFSINIWNSLAYIILYIFNDWNGDIRTIYKE